MGISFKELLEKALVMEFGTAGSSLKQIHLSYEYLCFFGENHTLEYYKKQVNEFLKEHNSSDFLIDDYYLCQIKPNLTCFQFIINNCEGILSGKKIGEMECAGIKKDDLGEIAKALDFIKIVKFINDNTDLKMKISDSFTASVVTQAYIILDSKSEEIDNEIKMLKISAKEYAEKVEGEEKKFNDVRKDTLDLTNKLEKLEGESKRNTISGITTLSVFSAIVISVFGSFEIVNTTFVNFEQPILITLIVFFAIYNIINMLVILVLRINSIQDKPSKVSIILVNIIFVLLIIIFYLKELNVNFFSCVI